MFFFFTADLINDSKSYTTIRVLVRLIQKKNLNMSSKDSALFWVLFIRLAVTYEAFAGRGKSFISNVQGVSNLTSRENKKETKIHFKILFFFVVVKAETLKHPVYIHFSLKEKRKKFAIFFKFRIDSVLDKLNY